MDDRPSPLVPEPMRYPVRVRLNSPPYPLGCFVTRSTQGEAFTPASLWPNWGEHDPLQVVVLTDAPATRALGGSGHLACRGL